VADEIDALPDDFNAIPAVITDYIKVRDRIRHCEEQKEKL